MLSVRLMRNAYRHPFLIALNFLATLAAAVGLALIFHNTGTDTGGIQNRCGAWRRSLQEQLNAGSLQNKRRTAVYGLYATVNRMLAPQSSLNLLDALVLARPSVNNASWEPKVCLFQSEPCCLTQAWEPVLHAAVPVDDQPQLAAGLARRETALHQARVRWLHECKAFLARY